MALPTQTQGELKWHKVQTMEWERRRSPFISTTVSTAADGHVRTNLLGQGRLGLEQCSIVHDPAFWLAWIKGHSHGCGQSDTIWGCIHEISRQKFLLTSLFASRTSETKKCIKDVWYCPTIVLQLYIQEVQLYSFQPKCMPLTFNWRCIVQSKFLLPLSNSFLY